MISSFRFSLPTYRLLATGIALFVLALINADAKASATPPLPPNTEPHYFFTIDFDPQYQIVGTGALTEVEAATANCYCFTYDTAGKVLRIEYHVAGTPRPDPFLQVVRIDFEHHAGVERRWYRDAKGEPMRDIDEIEGEELSLNAAGFPTDITNLDASGARTRDSRGVYHYARTLDDKGRLIKGRCIGLLGIAITDNNGTFETRRLYDEQGRENEVGNYDASGNPLNNSDGIATTRTGYTVYPDSTQIIKSYFDASGQAVEEKDTGVHQIQRTIDKRGLLIDEAYFDANGEPTLTTDGGIYERRCTYDDRGNVLSEEFFGTDGKPKNGKINDFSRLVYKYDDKNRVIEKSYFGDDGTPQVLQNLGAAIIRQEYDDQGNLVRRQFFDGLGHPSPHVKYGSPAIRIKVDEDTTIITLRNDEDKPMKNPISGFYAFSYKTSTDSPLTKSNLYFDRNGHPMSLLRVFIINPHLHALKTTPIMRWSARYGAGVVGLGSLLACFLAMRKSTHTKKRKVYVPTLVERFLGWFSVFAILEGSLRFFITVYWAEVGYLNVKMGPAVYVLETIFIIFFLYRLLRIPVTMRVLNIEREDVHRLVRDFFTKAHLKPEWIEAKKLYSTPAFGVRVRFFRQKYHAYISFERQQFYSPLIAVSILLMILWFICFGFDGWQYIVPASLFIAYVYARLSRPDRKLYREGRDLTRAMAQYIRTNVRQIQAPTRSRAIALYYPIVAFCYFLLACTAFYTLAQLIKGY